ncbi:MAG: zf-HC2 domain-containing protein [Bacteroidales bacterium]|nr:zf-HC2 domain-containing protein [Bacteroidales bacterium]
MQCKEIHNDYIGYLDGTLDAETNSMIEEHLLSCNHCRDFVERLKSLQVTIEREKNIQTSETFFENIQDKLEHLPKSPDVKTYSLAFRIAASVALIMFGTWMGLWIGKGFHMNSSLSNDYKDEIYYLYDIQQGIVENNMLSDLTE